MTNQERLAKVSATKQAKFKKSIEHVDIDELRKLYIDENKTYDFIRKHYHLTGHTLDRILRENNIKKSRKQSAALVLETKYRNAGSKENYDKQTYETAKHNIEAKGLSIEQHYANISNQCRKTWQEKTPQEIENLVKQLRTIYFNDADKIEHAKQKRIETNLQRYGVDNSYKLATYTNNSGPNATIEHLLTTQNIAHTSELFIKRDETGSGFRYDFCLNNNILLEINPWPFHNSSWSPIENIAPIAKNYHYQKYLTAKQNNYRCIHLWDWDNTELIISSLKCKQKIFARACVVKLIEDKSLLDTFLVNNHFQGTCKNQTIALGLYLKNTDELLQVMTFGKPRYNKKYQYELLRLCTKQGHYVIGGAEKLYKYFQINYTPTSIISYCDNSKFSGDVYKRLGMQLIDKGGPTCHWYNIKTGQHITDNLLRQRGFDQLFSTNYGKGTSNRELMLQHNFVEIYDCGQSTYVWTLN